MMKRLLCIVGKMDAGGAETFLMKNYRKLDREHYQIDFIVTDPEKGFYEDEITSLGGKIFRIPPKTKGTLKNFLSIKNIVKDNKYEYVLRVSQHSLSALELFAAKLGGARKTCFRSSNSNTTSSSRINVLLHEICRFMPLHFANVRFAPSTEAAEFMFGKNCIKKGKAVLFPNAIDLDTFRYNSDSRNRIRNEFGIGDEFVIGHIGRFNLQKNHSLIIAIFKEIKKLKPESKLLLVGTGELFDRIKEQIANENLERSVIFTGKRQDIPSLLSAMDLFLFPSFYEGMPNTVIEAQASGLPCIISAAITREAAISKNVHFVDLSEKPAAWAKRILDTPLNNEAERRKECDLLKGGKYDSNTTIRDFEHLIFD